MKHEHALDLALEWAARGVGAFPVRVTWDAAKGKTNKTPFSGTHGYHDATTDPERLRRMFAGVTISGGADLAVGLHPGPAGFVVLDDDGGLADAGLDLPATYSPTTASGGGHHWFRKTTEVEIGNECPWDGMDVRADKGLVVAPGSEVTLRTSAGFEHFAWTDPGGFPEVVADLPDEVLAQLNGAGSRGPGGRVGTGGARAAWGTYRPDEHRELLPAATAQAVEVVVALGGHNATLRRQDGREPWVEVTRPGKDAGTSASVGWMAPGTVWFFTPNWPTADGTTFTAERPYVIDGGALVLDDDRPVVSINSDAGIDDAHMAAGFADAIRGRFLFVGSSRRWRRWDGRRWAPDDTEAVFEEARRWVLDLGTKLLRDGAKESVVAKVAGYRNRSRLDAIVTLARRIDGIAATADEFDVHPDLLNVGNGVVDLRTGNLLPHDPKLRMTKLAPVDYRPGADHPDLEAVLAVVEEEVAVWLLVVLGYAATGHTSEDLVAVWDGGGANGKTTLLEAVGAALGDYAGPAPAQLIMRSSRDEHPTIKADLQGKRLVWISETEEGGSLRMEQVKALTGGDRIKARVMRGDYFEFTPTHTLIVATNHRPFVNATEHAAWRRLRLVPFPFTYRPEAEAGPGDRVRDPKLRHRLATGTAQREAVLAALVEGAMTWYATGIPPCPEIESATDTWRRSEDVILRFVAEELTFSADLELKGSELYAVYRDWCQNEGRPAKSNKNFVAEFLSHEDVVAAGIEVVRPGNVVHYRGVGKAGTHG